MENQRKILNGMEHNREPPPARLITRVYVLTRGTLVST
jgi:hypothetical protein